MLRKIFTEGSMTLSTYAEALNVSSRTLQRDINDLIRIGFPFERHGGTITLKGNKRLGIPDLDLSESDKLFVANLLNLADSYFGELDQDNIRSMRRALAKTFINKKQRNHVLSTSNYYHFLNKRLEHVKYSVLKTLETAMVENRRLFVVYAHPSKKDKSFPFEPNALVFTKSHWYAFGRNTQLEARLFYRVSRIKELILSEEQFAQLGKEEVEKMLSNVWEVHYGERSYEIAVRFVQSAVERLTETERHPSQVVQHNEDGSATLTVNVCGYREFMWWVLSWGAQAEILSPQWIREKLAKEVWEISNLYLRNSDK
jgi:proteasome accessory factor B